ncbi:MAG TPA: Ku protein [Actinomycetota bacterium]|nr:Ku protein [Actinomycetota bacterium]
MARSVWNGTLSFGLVSIRVSLYPATEAKDVRFHLFDREGRRVRYRRVVEAGPGVAGFPSEIDEEPAPSAPADSEPEEAAAPVQEDTSGSNEVEVAYEDLVRGYEVEPEAFVFLEPRDLERARPTPSRSIELEQFVRLEEIDPIFFEKTYYVVPAHGAEKPYALLQRTLRGAGRVGIGRFVLRTKPHLVALRPLGDVLAIETLFFGDEVRDPRGLVGDVGDLRVSDREVAVARQLVEILAADWEPSQFSDEYREELLKMIAERTPERVEFDEETEAPARGRIEDLMDALRRSVDEAKKGQRGSKGRRRTG